MKKDIILAGVGGQGILSIATIIGYVAVQENLFLKQAEVHGMSQRGGDVQSHLRISDKEIYSDLIPDGKADLILSVEPMESLRYMPFLGNDGWIVTNTKTFVNIPDYPEEEVLNSEITKIKNHVALNADAIAKEKGSSRSMNMVMLGAAAPFLGLPVEKLEDAVKAVFGRKGEAIVEKNLECFRAGLEIAQKIK
ncbi:MAG: indolepyruvate oxidoreductase [Candidatus Cloacimonadota bacterium]|nr:MAG: indolepyruvate oxidoreductase [Candidatus Cloacimonadota bacterium]